MWKFTSNLTRFVMWMIIDYQIHTSSFEINEWKSMQNLKIATWKTSKFSFFSAILKILKIHENFGKNQSFMNNQSSIGKFKKN